MFICLSIAGCSSFSARKPAGHNPSVGEKKDLSFDQLERSVHQAASQPHLKNFVATDLFLKANMALIENDYFTASALFGLLVQLEPEDQFVLKKLAIAHIRAGNLEESKAVLEKLYKGTNDEKVGMILAGVYTGLDQEKQARSLYQDILAKNRSNEDACIFLGKSFAVEKKFQKALDQLSACGKRDNKNGIYDYYIGKIYVDQGHTKLAAKSFASSLRKQPDLPQAVIALGAMYEQKEKHQQAISLYSDFLKKDPENSTILSKIIQSLFFKERYAEVIPYAEKLIDLEPENLNLKVKLGVLYTDAKKYYEAISVFKDLLSLAPGSDKILYYLGAIYQELKDYDKAIEYFNLIPSSSGLYSDSSIQMASMLSELAQVEYSERKEEKNIQKMFLSHINLRLEEIPEMRVELSVIKAGFFEGIGDYKSAMDAMAVVQDEKNFSNSHKYYLANLYEKEKKYQEATNLIMGIVLKEPKNAHAWNYLGYSMLVRGDEPEKALEYINKALKLSPKDGYIRDSLGWYYFKTGQIKKALVELHFAVKQVPNDVEILKHLAEVYKQMRQYDKARIYLQDALKMVKYPIEKLEILTSIEKLEADRLPASEKLD
jgi:tetratricopeptide (TPR) repeat protein